MSASLPRILLVDDNRSIHEDFKQILSPPAAAARDAETLALENEIFGTGPKPEAEVRYIIDDAYQGEEAIAMVERAEQEGHPYSLIFMDVRMPPGIDGIQTILQLWERHPFIEAVICTAYSDYSWDDIVAKFGRTDHLLFLKKPFDGIALRQLTLSLTTKWELDKKNRDHLMDLENQIRVRTQELRDMVQHLSQLKAQAESEMMAKSDLLSSVSIEIRTPLNGIMGMTDLLLDTDLSTEQKNYAETIKTSSDSIYAIASDIFNLARIESGQVEIANISFDIRTAIANVAELVSIRAREASTHVTTLVHSDIPEVVIGDPERFRQLLFTIVSSIVKVTRSGELLLSAFPDRSGDERSPTAAPPSLDIRFELSDTCSSLSEKARREVIAQLNDGRTRQETGATSIGLAVASRLCALMGGTMAAEDEPGKGFNLHFTTRFQLNGPDGRVRLPALKNLEQTRVLILGDNPTSRKVLSLYIRHWGGKGAEASGIPEALEMLHTALDTITPYDMVIVDYHDGDIERYAAVALEIRKHKNLDKVPLICLTSRSKRGDTREIEAQGYSGYLTKPLKQTHLYNCIGMVKQARDSGPTGYSGIITKHLIDETIRDRYTVLVVESELQKLQTVVYSLERLGIRCDVAAEKEKALRAIVTKDYDLVLLSCASDDGAGLELAREVRLRVTAGRHTPIVGLVWDGQVDREACKAAGMDDCLIEPDNIETMQSVLKVFFEEHDDMTGVN